MQSNEKKLRPDHNQLEPEHRDILRGLEIVPAADEFEWADSLTEEEEEELANLLNGYDEFAARLMNAPKQDFDSFTAASALTETLDSANQIVDVMLRAGVPADRKRKTSLWAQVAECEEKTADLLHRLARLRRELQKPGGPAFV
jgi:hypothetical protein